MRGLGFVNLDGALLPLAIAMTSALCGLALIGDDLRARTRREGRDAERTPWQQMTAAERVRGLPWRVVVGGLLVGWSALLTLAVAGPVITDSPMLLLVLVVAVVLGALVVIGLPVLVSVAASADRARLSRAREEERRRVAAHLHDSVLQTLSLVQRQAHDPVAVAHLAHRQERALRAWMAGRPESGPDTLAGALEAAVEQVEGDERVEVGVTLNGDRALDAAGDELVAAAREALRNAARHAPGAAIVMFAEIDASAVAVYVRDEGPGFDVPAVPPERRGVRDAIVGRMAAIGGQATVESEPGEGTEVTLRLPAARNGSAQMTSAAAIRVVLVDDHHLFRAGVRAELAGTFEIVGEAGSVAEAIAVIAACEPDVVLLDVHLPDGGGRAVLDACRAGAAGAGERGPAFLALSVSDAAGGRRAGRACRRARLRHEDDRDRGARRRDRARASRRRVLQPAAGGVRPAGLQRARARRAARRPRARAAHAARARRPASPRPRLSVQADRQPPRDQPADRRDARQLGLAQAPALDAPRAEPLGEPARARRTRRAAPRAR